MRCSACQIVQQHCICQWQPDIETDFAVLLILSDNEILKPSNTGRLIADTVSETYAFQWHRTEPNSQMLALLEDPHFEPMVVFPEEYVDQPERLLSLKNYTKSNKTPLLIFIDGSWREAKRIFRRSEYLHSLPVISVEPTAISQYLMRKASKDNHLSTAEVASIVIRELGDDFTSKTLSLWFDVFRESYMLSKTRIKSNIELRDSCLDSYKKHVKMQG